MFVCFKSLQHKIADHYGMLMPISIQTIIQCLNFTSVGLINHNTNVIVAMCTGVTKFETFSAFITTKNTTIS